MASIRRASQRKAWLAWICMKRPGLAGKAWSSVEDQARLAREGGRMRSEVRHGGLGVAGLVKGTARQARMVWRRRQGSAGEAVSA